MWHAKRRQTRYETWQQDTVTYSQCLVVMSNTSPVLYCLIPRLSSLGMSHTSSVLLSDRRSDRHDSKTLDVCDMPGEDRRCMRQYKTGEVHIHPVSFCHVSHLVCLLVVSHTSSVFLWCITPGLSSCRVSHLVCLLVVSHTSSVFLWCIAPRLSSCRVMTFQEIRIIATGPCIPGMRHDKKTDEVWDTTRREKRYETRQQPEPLNRNESGRFGALKSDSTHHFFRNACTKSGSLRFSVFWLKICLRHTLIKNILDIFLDFFIFIHFHYMKMYRL
jgi:hypothetical protein